MTSQASSQPRSLFLDACRRQPVPRTPIWLMRQAGRYLPEYRAVRDRYEFLTMCKTPEIAAEITMQPVRRFGLDAAIVFADILLPLEAMGMHLRFAEGEGPVIDDPIRSEARLQQLRPAHPKEALSFVLEAIRLVVSELPATPVIGFAGAPFTLCCYAVEGRSSRDFRVVKSLMWSQPVLFHALMRRMTDSTISYLLAQIEAGAAAVQLFDSWAGVLSPSTYAEYVLPYTRQVLHALTDVGVPVIHFALGTSSYVEVVARAGGDVLSVDWRIDLAAARERSGGRFAIQGNLDPAVLLTNPDVIRKEATRILKTWGNQPGHIFNLGHGIHQQTPPENVAALVETVHLVSSRRA